jgi:hypothetical protein
MRQRLEKFALSLHPEKTRLIEFGRFAAKDRESRGLGKPETFQFSWVHSLSESDVHACGCALVFGHAREEEKFMGVRSLQAR